MAGVGTFISVGKSLDQAVERTRKAETLGFDSVYVTHIAARDSLAVLMAYAAATDRIRLGTGVLPIYSRHPVATAQIAATIDEYSGGRMVLGLGVSHQVTVENWYSSKLDRPVAAMREYVETLRAMFTSSEPPPGELWPTKFQFMGFDVRSDLPIYVAALSPRMLRLAGEVADGVLLWLCNPNYIRDVVVPEVSKGREQAGKTLENFDVVAAVPAAVTEDRDATFAEMRSELITYASLPFYRTMLERSGFGEEIAAFDAGIREGDMEKAKAGLSDRFLESLSAAGTPDEARAGIQRYLDAGTTSPCAGPMPGADFEATLEAIATLIS